MRKPKELTGQRIGRLVVLSKSNEKYGRQSIWQCKCDCGSLVSVRACHLTSGHTKSCGCLQKETIAKTATKHGKSGERILGIWYGIRKRCYNPNSKSFKDYGGRGIAVCDEWKDNFQAFYDWAMANGYSDDLTIDRKDVDGNYCPENCRWITNQEQQNNRRTSHLVTYKGETHTLKDWAKITGINYNTLRGRITNYKWNAEKAFTTPINK